MPQFSDSIYLGGAQTLITNENGNPGGTGVGPMGRIYVWDTVPLTLQTAGLAILQTLGAAGNFTLAAGTGVTTTVLANGTTAYVLDVPRCVTFTSTADISAVTVTVSGYDVYGQPMSAARAGPNNNTVATTKAFKMVTQVAASAAVGTNTSVGFNDKLGIPFRMLDVVYVASVRWASTLAADAGTFVAADTTSPATVSTTDVRGCYTPSSAADGSKRLVMGIYIPAVGSGPNATRTGALGVTQV